MCEKLSKLSTMQGLLRPGARFSASAPKHALVLGHRESKTALEVGKSSEDVIRDVGFWFANRRRKVFDNEGCNKVTDAVVAIGRAYEF